MPIVDFHKAKAEIEAKAKPRPQTPPEGPAKVTTIAEAKAQVEEQSPQKQGALTAAELAEIQAIAQTLMAEQAAVNS